MKESPLPGLEPHRPMAYEERMRLHGLRANRFIIAAMILQMPPLAVWAGGQLEQIGEMPWHGVASPLLEGEGLLLLAYGVLMLAYLLGKTSQAIGQGFLASFAMGLVPPLLPAVCARLGGRRAWRPYGWLSLDVALIGAAWTVFHHRPLVLAAVCVFLAPFIIYHLLGCAVQQLAGVLGLSPVWVVPWLCLGPLLLGLALVLELGWADVMSCFYGTAAEALADLAGLFRGLDLADCAGFQSALCIYLVATWALWIRGVHQGLKLPVV